MNLKSPAAFLFPGQGSQTPGMGKDLAETYPIARQLFDQADALLGFPLSSLMWNGPKEQLDDTLNTQPALYLHSIAAWTVFTHLFPHFKPAVLAGHSLGELSALTAAGALSFTDGLLLVRRRGELMQRAGEQNPGGMAAILGLDLPTLEQICAQASAPGETVQIANDNCPGQIVISGHTPALQRAIENAKAAGARRALPLAVSIAAHSPLMDTIQREWNAAIDACPLNDPLIPIISNVHARPMHTAEELRADLKAQMQSRVRWTESVQTMLEMGIQAFVEAGSGEVLLGLVKRIAPSASRFPLGAPADFQALQ
jgi:[acyl-carrier-protein] S-malonyltransferase